MQNFEQVRSHVTSAGYRVTVQEPYVLCVELSLDQGARHQSIFLVELQDDDGRGYLRVSTAVAPTGTLDPARFRPLEVTGRVRLVADGRFHSESFGEAWDAGPTVVIEAGNVTWVVGSMAARAFCAASSGVLGRSVGVD